jgi:hypothetical protein
VGLAALPDSDGQRPSTVYERPFDPVPPIRLDGFLAYSRRRDARLAAYTRRGLERFIVASDGRRLSLRIYRHPPTDNLPTTATLLPSICNAIDCAAWFILMASEESARSRWVNRELRRWLAHKSADRVLVVHTGGTCAWDHSASTFDLLRSSAIHPEFRLAFTRRPPIIDMTWATAQNRSSMFDGRFSTRLGDIAATILGLPRTDIDVTFPANGLLGNDRSRR